MPACTDYARRHTRFNCQPRRAMPGHHDNQEGVTQLRALAATRPHSAASMRNRIGGHRRKDTDDREQ